MITYAQTGAVGTVTMDRPPVNALDDAFIAAFDAALDQAEKGNVTLLVVRSGGRCFCAGADLAFVRTLFERTDAAARMTAYVTELHRLFRRVESFPGVTLAVINGPALGGGLELALSCDLRIASAAAKLGLPEARVGLIPGAGGTQRLTRLCGPGIASRIILGCDIIDGAEAERLGVVQWSATPEELNDKTDKIATQVAGLSHQALVTAKDCIFAYLDPAADGFARELSTPQVLMASEDARRRVNRFFEAA